MNPLGVPQTLFEDLTTAHQALDKLIKHIGHEPPKDLEILAGEVGLKIDYTDELPEKIGGMLSNITDDGGILSVNSTKPKIFQQYSIAHEIGHFYLFHDYEAPEEHERQEQQANAFAFFLLMKVTEGDELRKFMKANPDLFNFSHMAGMMLIMIPLQGVPWLAIPLGLLYTVFFHWKMSEPEPEQPSPQGEQP